MLYMFVLQNTGLDKWLEMYYDLLKTEMINEIFSDPLNFDDTDGLVKDSVLTALGITCPNMCGGQSRGKCVKSKYIL
jgi:hypothetical protein